MAEDDIVARFVSDSRKLISDLKEQVRLYRESEKAQEDVGKQSKENQKSEETNAQKRKRLLREEVQDLRELKKRRKDAFDPDEIAEYNKRINETERRVRNLSGQYDKLEKKTGTLNSTFQRLGTTIVAAFTVDRLIRFGREAVELAAKAEGVERAFNRLNNPTLLNDLRKATRGTVSDLELMQQAVRADNFKLPLNQLAKLFEFATLRASQTGESVDYLVNSITEGISKRSIRILDNLGFTTDILAEKLGNVGLTGASTGEIMTAVGQIIDEEMEKAGEQIETTAQRTARLAAENENLKTSVGESLTPVYNEFLKVLNNVLQGMRSTQQVIKEVRDSQLSDSIREDINEVDRLAKSYLDNGVALDEMSAKAKAAKDIIDQYKGVLETATGAQRNQILEQIKALSSYIDQETAVTENTEVQNDLNKAIEEYNQKVNNLIPDLRALEREILDGLLSKGNLVKFWEDQGQKLSLDDLIEIPEDEEAGVLLPGFEEEFKRIQELGFESFEEFFAWKADKEKEDAERMKELYSEVYNSIFQIASNNIAREAQERLAAIDTTENRRLQSIERQYEVGILTEEEYRAKQEEIQAKYDEERKKVQIEQAEREKKLAIFQATIQGLVAVVEALPNIPLSILAGIAAGAKITAIASTPIPQFFEGTEYLMPWAPGQGRRKDDIPVMAHMGEAIIKTERNKEAPGLAKAWNSGNLEKWIFKQYDVPAIRDKVAESEREEKNSFVRNIADGLTRNFGNQNIAKAIKEGLAGQNNYLYEFSDDGLRKYVVTGNTRKKRLNKRMNG